MRGSSGGICRYVSMISGEYSVEAARSCEPLGGGKREARESRKGEAIPVELVVTNRFSCLYAHNHRGILFDLADLTELDVFGETGHERGAKAGATEVARAETREKEKQHATQDHRSGRHAESGKTQCAIQSSVALGVHMKNRRDGAEGSAAQFHSHESGNAEQEKDEEKNQEGGIDGKNGRGQNTCKREHGEK